MTTTNKHPKAQDNEALHQVLEINRGRNGYGFTLSGQAPCSVSWVVEDSPADQIGLTVGDCILSINGKDVSSSTHEDVVKLIGVSTGTLFLGVTLPNATNSDKSNSEFVSPIKKGFSSFQEARKSILSFSRTEKVLQDLHSGILFKKLHANNLNSVVENKQASKRSSSLPTLVVMKSVVAYLGTVDLGNIEHDCVEESSFNAVKGCVQALRMEQHIHQRVLMIITQSSVKLCNADGEVVAMYKAENLVLSSSYLHDARFFYLVTVQDLHKKNGSRYMNHIFMIDPDISKHSLHVDKARRFGIECTTGDNGNCVEFPASARSLLAVIRLLHVTVNEKPARRASLDERNKHMMALNQHPQSILTRGDSTLPRSSRLSSKTTWIENSRRQRAEQHPNKLASTSFRYNSTGEERMKDSSSSFSKSVQQKTIPRQPTAPTFVLKTPTPGIKRQILVSELQTSHVPPPMQRLSLGKYRIPDAKRTPTGSLDRLNIRKAKGDRQHGKRHGRLFPSHVTSNQAMSKSFENVNTSEEDLMSAASSIESLASNASLPSCINGSITGTLSRLDRPIHRNSTPNTSAEEGAGRISHWAVSFDRLLEDPLGVKYFKEFLRKEFSEENILFWEACEELRRCDPNDLEKLKKDVKEIYERFLSLEAEMGVNIDGQGQQQAEEALQLPPHPNIFFNQQQQVYTLMKLDSYSRFLKSTLYRQCMLSEMEGRVLPLEAADNGSFDFNGSDLSRGGSRSLDSDTIQRQTKKFKGSTKRGIFSKIRSKSQREKFAGAPLTRQSSGDSTGSDSSCTPLHRTASLPANSHDLIDPSRMCHVTLWDNSSTVIYAKKPGCNTIREALSELVERRGAHVSSVEVFLIEDNQRRLIGMDLDVSCLASHSIVVELRSLLRIDIKPAGKSVSVKSRSNKTILAVLESVLNKYELDIDDVIIKHSEDGRDVPLHDPVSTLDGLRILVDGKLSDVKNAKRKEKTKSKSFKNSIPDKKDTEELIQLMSSLQSSKMHDQRGLICKEDLELPEFLKIKPIDSANNNNNNSSPVNGTGESLHTSPISNCDSDFSKTSGYRPHIDTSGRRGSRTDYGKNTLYVEYNARPKSLTTFKPETTSSTGPILEFHKESELDDCDATIIEDSNLDLDLTLVPLPTPPRERVLSGDFSMPNHTPPTPIHRK